MNEKELSIIKLATPDDLPELHRMGKAFHKASGYVERFDYDQDTMELTFSRLIYAGCLFTDGFHGMIGFIVFPVFFNSSAMLSQELFWWVDPEYRRTGLGTGLIDCAESKSLEMGAANMIMLSLDGPESQAVNKMYESRGYNKAEQSYIRRL